MFRLRLRFESAWTNVLATRDDGPLFVSSRGLKGSLGALVPVALDGPVPGEPVRAERGETRRLVRLRAVQAASPGIGYRMPASFDDTVRGVLARLVGEVRRLRRIEAEAPGHLALRAFERGRYRLDVEREHVRPASLASRLPPRDPNIGAGLIRGRPLYEDAAVGRFLFGHLDSDVDALVDALARGHLPEGDWRPRSPGALADRLDRLGRATTRWTALARAARDVDALERFARAWMTLDPGLDGQVARALDGPPCGDGPPFEDGPSCGAPDPVPWRRRADAIAGGALGTWHLAAAVAVARVGLLDDRARAELVRRRVLSGGGRLGGITTRGAVGRVGRRDLCDAASEARPRSRRVPYGLDVLSVPSPDGSSARVETGLIVRDGTLSFAIDDDEALEGELERAIVDASVGPLRFGKKGVAWVEMLARRCPIDAPDG